MENFGRKMEDPLALGHTDGSIMENGDIVLDCCSNEMIESNMDNKMADKLKSIVGPLNSKEQVHSAPILSPNNKPSSPTTTNASNTIDANGATNNKPAIRDVDDDDDEEDDIIEKEEDEEDSDDSTSDSNYSDLTDISDISGREWKPISSLPLQWVQKQMHCGADPRELLSQIIPSTTNQWSPGLNDMTLWRILTSLISEPPRRQKLSYVNTFDDVVQLILQSSNIIVLTGAGVSVSCGIPDFRSIDGIYARLSKDFPDLPDPQAMFDIGYFSRDPRPFYRFAREIYPGQFQPSPCHRFIKLLEEKGKLLRNYTQNIDTLEQVVGIKNVIECHGSFATATCTKCKFKCTADAIKADIFAQKIPVCPKCQPAMESSVVSSDDISLEELRRILTNGIMKPDIVFFGEGLPQEFHTVITQDKEKCDLLIVMGSSLKVRPVALIPSSISSTVPQILINREKLQHLNFDVELLGNADVIINQLCHCLGDDDWKSVCFSEMLTESKTILPINSKANENDLPSSDDVDSKSCTDSDSPTLATATPNDSDTEASTLCDTDRKCSRQSQKNNTHRHLSIDSSKDSGIQSEYGQASNSAVVIKRNNHTKTIDGNSADESIDDKVTDDGKPVVEDSAQEWIRQQQTRSEMQRLISGTYYHRKNSIYIFTGAQINWYSDSEEEEEDNNDDNNCNDNIEEENKKDNQNENENNVHGGIKMIQPIRYRYEKKLVNRLSPIVSPSSVDSEMDSGNEELDAFKGKKYTNPPSSCTTIPSTSSCTSNTANECYAPVAKRCRNSIETEQETEETSHTSTAIIANASISNDAESSVGIIIQTKCNNGNSSLQTALR